MVKSPFLFLNFPHQGPRAPSFHQSPDPLKADDFAGGTLFVTPSMVPETQIRKAKKSVDICFILCYASYIYV